MTDKEFVLAHPRFVAAAEHQGAASIVIRARDGVNTDKTVMLASLAWACVATALQADDAIAAARAAQPRRVVELDDILDFDGAPWPWHDEELHGRAS